MALWRPQVFRSLAREEVSLECGSVFFVGGYACQDGGAASTSAANSGRHRVQRRSRPLLLPLRGKSPHLLGLPARAAGFGLYYLTVPNEGVKSSESRRSSNAFLAAASYAVHIILVSEYTKEHSLGAERLQ